MSSKKQKNIKTNQDSPERLKGSESSRSVEPTTISAEAASIWKALLKSAKTDVGGGMVSAATEQVSVAVLGGQLQEGQAVSLKQKQQHVEAAEKPEKKVVTEAFMDYKREVINSERSGERRVEHQTMSAIEEVRMEIQKLQRASKMVEQTVKDAAADKAPVKPGKYHLAFFTWVLSVLRGATQKLEDTASFGAVFTSKKQQSKYWNNVKSSGTSFQLSGERTVATQVG